MANDTHKPDVAIIGAGPAGLIAADFLSVRGLQVSIYEKMPSAGRKLLMAGKSGLNITHSEEKARFLDRYAPDWPALRNAIEAFDSSEVVRWVNELGSETFVGSSRRIFPKEMKASPLLRSLLRRLEAQGCQLFTRHELVELQKQSAVMKTTDGDIIVEAKAILLALGGASWKRLGSDGAWTQMFNGKTLTPFGPVNCGFNCNWSNYFVEKFAGEPVKTVQLKVGDETARGDFVITKDGVEGSAIYTHSKAIQKELSSSKIPLLLDLAPDRSAEQLAKRLQKPKGKNSFSNQLRKSVGVSGVKAGLLREAYDQVALLPPEELAALIKAVPVKIIEPRPLDEAISVSGGVSKHALNNDFMLKEREGVFCAGEMLDWDAPTGGYLLTGCFATGMAAAKGILKFLDKSEK